MGAEAERRARTEPEREIAGSESSDAAMRPLPCPPDARYHRFTRGKKKPRGVVWFGLKSFWGHAQHFIASAIATEDIDSRDWMHADDPARLCEEVARHLGAGKERSGSDSDSDSGSGGSLTERVGRDLWIDYVADTGDDSSVAEAVAGLMFREYALPDGEREIVAPRGDLLVFGGDTAYPVSTANEIHDRVVVPFNRVLTARRGVGPQPRRAILGVPGNHDWYDGLDGFGRLFRKRVGELAPEVGHASVVPDRVSRLEQVVDFVEKFAVGGKVEKKDVLVLDGYQPFQHATYWGLPLAPKIDLYAADRQLRHIDFRQRRYFGSWREGREQNFLMLLLPDPVYAFLDPSPTGVGMIKSLELNLDYTPTFVLSGDIHHYERRSVGETLHVTAGGGGAFLHPARLAAGDRARPAMEWPGVEATRALLWQVAPHVALGRAGFLPHVLLLLLFAPALGISVHYFGTFRSVNTASIVAGVFSAIVLSLIGGIRNGPRSKSLRIAALAALAGAATAFVPIFVAKAFRAVMHLVGMRMAPGWDALLVLLLATFVGAFCFGAYLATLTGLGLESTQAFTCLGHPGFKHFVRLRVRKDGSAIDGWVLGLLDPLAPDAKPVLVDRFTWRPR